MIVEHSRLRVEASSVREIMCAEEFPELIEKYAAEAKIEGLPPPNARLETYLHLEALGMIHAFSAISGNRLVGFISILAPTAPHYGVIVAVCESFFVAKADRASGAGLRLLRTAEDRAREIHSPGLLVSAPMGGKLFELLPRCGYVESNRVFFKRFYDA